MEASIFIIHLLHQNGIINIKAKSAFIIFIIQMRFFKLKAEPSWTQDIILRTKDFVCSPKGFFRVPSQYLSSLLENIVDLCLKLAINIKVFLFVKTHSLHNFLYGSTNCFLSNFVSTV